IGDMCWSEINLENGIWTLPAARAKNGRAHTLPLLPMARRIIEAVPRMAGRDQIFGVRGRGFGGWVEGKEKLEAQSGVSGWVLHDLRRTLATTMAETLKVAPHVIEALLNHISGDKSGVAGIYNRATYANEVRTALALWEDHIRTLVEGGERKILPLPSAAP